MIMPDFTGPGYFAGEAPDGLTTVAGVPVSAQVRVYWRDPDDPNAAEVLVDTTQSSASGSWRIVDVNPELQYVIRGIKAGYNDVSVNGCVPTRTDAIDFVSVLPVPAGMVNAAVGAVRAISGLPPYALSLAHLPAGVDVVLGADRRTASAQGVGVDGEWLAAVTYTAARDVSRTIYLWSQALVDAYFAADIRFVFSAESYTPPPQVVFIF